MAAGVDGACQKGTEQGGRNGSAEGFVGATPLCNQTLLIAPPYSPEATAAFATAITLMVLFTIVGNILVIIAVLTSRSLRGPQNLFLVSLAAADILVATLIVPFSLAKELMGYWYFRSLWCEIHLALDVLFCTSSIVHLCAISLDRYLSISRAVVYSAQRTPERIKGAILVVWLISAVISFPPLLSMNKSKGGEAGSSMPKCELNNDRWYILYSTIGSFFAPCLIMILVYIRIYQIAKQHTRCPLGKQQQECVAAAPVPQKVHVQGQQNGGSDGSPAPSQKSCTFGPPSLTVPLPPSPSQSKRSLNAHSLLQPPSPSATPTIMTSPPGPLHMTLAPSLSSTHPPVKVDRPTENKKTDALRKKRVDTNGDSYSSESDTDAGPGDEGHRGSTAEELTCSGLHSPSSVQKYRDMIATSKGAVLVGWKSKQEGTAESARNKAIVNREKRFTFVLAVVIGVFVVCWFPFFFSYSLQAVCPKACELPKPIFTFFFWIGYCNSCLNPVIYTIFNKDFRRAFKKILCKNTKGTFF